jgi:hypothetical protein
MTESGKETADGQRVRRVARCQPRRAEREQYHAERRGGHLPPADSKIVCIETVRHYRNISAKIFHPRPKHPYLASSRSMSPVSF